MGSFLEVRLYTSDKATFDQHMQNIVDIYTEIHIISDYVESPKPDSHIINNLFTINEQMLSSQTDVEFEINQTFYEMMLLADELRNNTNGHFNVGDWQAYSSLEVFNSGIKKRRSFGSSKG